MKREKYINVDMLSNPYPISDQNSKLCEAGTSALKLPDADPYIYIS